jgi:uncharacterized protein
MPKVIHFEIPADDPERASKFYTDVFGWQIGKWGPVEYWLVNAGDDKEPGINGAIFRRDWMTTTTNTIGVPSVDDFTDKVVNNGGKVVRAKMAIPGIGWVAYCQDTEGNIFGIMQEDKSAR